MVAIRPRPLTFLVEELPQSRFVVCRKRFPIISYEHEFFCPVFAQMIYIGFRLTRAPRFPIPSDHLPIIVPIIFLDCGRDRSRSLLAICSAHSPQSTQHLLDH